MEFQSGGCDAAKRMVDAGLARLAACDAADLAAATAAIFAPDCRFHIAHPFNDLEGLDAGLEAFFAAIKHAFRHCGRAHAIVAAGIFNDAVMVAVMGHYRGTFAQDLAGIPANHKPVWLRFGEIHRIADGRIAESWMLPDMLDLMRQAGIWPIAPSLGAEGMWPAPGGNARAHSPVDAEADRTSFDLVLAMHAALGTFDGRTLESMDLAPYWTPDFAWCPSSEHSAQLAA